MGILVPEASLPMGVTVSNVYMSFTGEVIYISPQTQSNKMYVVSSSYKIYKDSTHIPETNIRIPISIPLYSMNQSGVPSNPYEMLYNELKLMYPGSTDVIESNDETSGGTLPIVYDESTPPVVYNDDAPIA